MTNFLQRQNNKLKKENIKLRDEKYDLLKKDIKTRKKIKTLKAEVKDLERMLREDFVPKHSPQDVGGKSAAGFNVTILDWKPYRVLHGHPDILRNIQLDPITWKHYILARLGLWL